MSEQELDLCSTQQLIDALERRFDACVFIGTKDLRKEEANTVGSSYGNPHTIVGLLRKATLVADMNMMNNGRTMEGRG